MMLLLIVIIWYQGSTKTQTRDKKKQNNIQPSEEIRQRKTAFDQDWNLILAGSFFKTKNTIVPTSFPLEFNVPAHKHVQLNIPF